MPNPDIYPDATAVDDYTTWGTPSGKPMYSPEVAAALGLDPDEDHSVIPELRGRDPTHNESFLIAGVPISMGSTNVDEIWYNWENRKLFVRFLNGGLYSYNGATLTQAVGMVETMSPGRYVWNVLRVEFPDEGTSDGTYTALYRPPRKNQEGYKPPKKPHVVRLHPKRKK